MKKGYWIDLLTVVFLVCALTAGYFGYKKYKETPAGKKVTVAIMRDPLVENYDTNYFTGWLEEKTGYDIEFEFITQGYEAQYIKSLLLDEKGRVDAVFLPEDRELISVGDFYEYVRGGYVCDLSRYAGPLDNIASVSDGRARSSFYYMPRMKNGKKDMNYGVLWLNSHWLGKLSLRIPETYEELEFVLRMFLQSDPNGNGVADELPLVTASGEGTLSFEDFVGYLMGNPDRGRTYCAELRERGLLSDACLDYTNRQMREAVNSSDDTIGAFAAKSISDYVYPNGTDVIARYVAVPPLKDADGSRAGYSGKPVEQIGGFIPENAANKKEAYEIMDLMLSEEASLIAVYGEKGVDYRDPVEGEISAYGNKAVLTTINYLKYSMQNKNYRGAGPSALPADMSDEVKWGGDGSYVEYMDARAVRLYGTKQDE